MKILTNAELARAHIALIKLAQQPMPLWILSQFEDLLEKLTEPVNNYFTEKAKYIKNGLNTEMFEKDEAVSIDDPIILPLDCDLCMSHNDLQALKGLIELERRTE